jgi:UDP-N-acetylmuramoylalanine--D-glutamate ligase
VNGGQRAVVVGLRATGAAVARALRAEAYAVTVADDNPTTVEYRAAADAMGAIGVDVVEVPRDWPAIVHGAVVVVPSPGVRPSHPAIAAARRAGIAVRSEIDLAAERIAVPLVAITGTNGKTTVTELVSAMLRASGLEVECGGNIGTPLISFAGTQADAVVAEVSSFQLEFTTRAFRPSVAVLLNIANDHLDWHGGLGAYTAAKAKVCAHQEAGDVLVVGADDPRAVAVAATARARVVSVAGIDGLSEPLRLVDGTRLVERYELRRALPHDITNALVAAEAAVAAGATVEGLRRALRDYAIRPHRVELVADADGVRWYDDSKATNPHAARRSIAAFESVVLLAGGLNKGLDLHELAAEAPRIRAVVTLGASAAEIEAAFVGTRPVERASSMSDAVERAARVAQRGDAVLLAPACASFDWYPDYEARGDDFARCVRTHLARELAAADRRTESRS